ncbi:MAG: DegT/DnrJ/EryC1/StrS family aminotransferase [Microcystaceae cyanobacterium]
MTVSPLCVPFVDLPQLHNPLEPTIQQAIHQVIEKGDFILGQAVKDFETAFAQASGVKYGVGVASGTAAIALGLQACGLQAGDEILVPANTFVATLMGVIQGGFTPILVDCCPDTALIDLAAAKKAITPSTKAIIPVHLYGQMVSPSALRTFADTHQLMIFEDAAQAHLGTAEGVIAGSVGKAAAFSFYPSKNLGAMGNGGILVTDDETVAAKMRSLRNYGAPQKYYHTDIGSNSRLDTIQAAILNVKLPYLAQWNQLRNQAASYYDQQLESLGELGIIPMKNRVGKGHVYHLYVVKLPSDKASERETIQKTLQEKGIQTGIHYPLPCHLQPAYRYLGYQIGDFPHAEALCGQILSLPMFPHLSQPQLDWVIKQLSELY